MTAKKPLPDVRPGQVWADSDKRMQGRKVKVIEVIDFAGEPTAVIEVIANPTSGDYRPIDPAKPRRTKVKVKRFVPNSTGYRLEQDVL